MAWTAAMRNKNKKGQSWYVVSGDTSTTSYVRRKAGLPPEPLSHTADDFQRFFTAIVKAVRAATASGPIAVSTDVGTSQSTKPSHSTITRWREVTPAEVRRTILAAPVYGIETLPKFSVAWVGCTNVTDDRRTTAFSRHRTLKMTKDDGGKWHW